MQYTWAEVLMFRAVIAAFCRSPVIGPIDTNVEELQVRAKNCIGLTQLFASEEPHVFPEQTI